MIDMQISFFSQALDIITNVRVLLPLFSDIDNSKKLPVLYLLHGYTGNCDDWVKFGNAHNICKNYNIAVVMPSAQNSFYVDMPYGQKFYTYIASELPNYIKKILPITNEPRHTYIAGLSMGGYGAFNIALNNPSGFNAVASLSGVVDIESAYNYEANDPINISLKTAYGNAVSDNYNLFKLAEKLNKNSIQLYMACGTEDFLLEYNEKFYNSFKDKLNIVYKKGKGDHEWEYWQEHLKNFLALCLSEYGIVNK